MAMLNESNLLAMKAKAAKFRTHHVGTKLNEAECAVLEKRARAVGLTLSEWVRDTEVGVSAPMVYTRNPHVLSGLLRPKPKLYSCLRSPRRGKV